MKTFKEHTFSSASYVEYHLHGGKKVILKDPKETKLLNHDVVTGKQIKARNDVSHVYGADIAITKQHIIGKSAIKKEVHLQHDLKYDHLVKKRK